MAFLFYQKESKIPFDMSDKLTHILDFLDLYLEKSRCKGLKKLKDRGF